MEVDASQCQRDCECVGKPVYYHDKNSSLLKLYSSIHQIELEIKFNFKEDIEFIDQGESKLPPVPQGKIRLYHGTSVIHLESVLKGIDSQKFKDYSDFGPAFYTTPSLFYAMYVAIFQATYVYGNQPVLIVYDVPIEEIKGPILNLSQSFQDGEWDWDRVIEKCYSHKVNSLPESFHKSALIIGHTSRDGIEKTKVIQYAFRNCDDTCQWLSQHSIGALFFDICFDDDF